MQPLHHAKEALAERVFGRARRYIHSQVAARNLLGHRCHLAQIPHHPVEGLRQLSNFVFLPYLSLLLQIAGFRNLLCRRHQPVQRARHRVCSAISDPGTEADCQQRAGQCDQNDPRCHGLVGIATLIDNLLGFPVRHVQIFRRVPQPGRGIFLQIENL